MERWVYDSDSGRPGRRRGLFVWLLDAAFAVVTALVALLLLFMYLAPYVSPDASWVFSVLGLVAPVIYVSGLVLFLYWVIRWRWGYASPMLVLLLLGVPKISLYYKIDTLRHYGEPVYDRSALKVMAYNVREPIRSRYSLYRRVQRPGTRCDDAFRFADRSGIPSGGLFARRRGDGRRRACRLFETAYPRFGRRRLC